MKRLVMILAVSFTMVLGCASVKDWSSSDSGKTTIKALAQIAGVALSIYAPEADVALNAVCAASGTRDQDTMVSALQQIWNEADKQQVTVVVESLNQLVGETKIMDKPATEAKLTEWQEVLGTICCATGKCTNP